MYERSPTRRLSELWHDVHEYHVSRLAERFAYHHPLYDGLHQLAPAAEAEADLLEGAAVESVDRRDRT